MASRRRSTTWPPRSPSRSAPCRSKNFNIGGTRERSPFQGVEHRIEFVREYQGVKYYNDSKATNTDAAIIALKAFQQPVILLMGGHEKGLDLSEMATYQSHISSLICFGEAKDRFAKEMHCPHTYVVEHMKDAVMKAKEIAGDGDIVLLSPSTSSYDEFSGYEERGRVFKKIVCEFES